MEDFVIVIDTSMSCSGQLVRRFLEETGSILSEQEHFFRTIHLHVIQCDDQVRQDAVLKSPENFSAFWRISRFGAEEGRTFGRPLNMWKV